MDRSPDALADKARQLRVAIRKAGKAGSATWLARQIDVLERRARTLKLRAGSAKSKQAAALLAKSAEESSRQFESVKIFMGKYKRYIGGVAQKLELRLVKIKRHLEDVQGNLKKKRGGWWKIPLATIKDVISIVNGILTIVTWVLKTFGFISLVA